MKTSLQKIVKTAFLFSIFFSLFSASAQAPQKMSYQAVIRNASNALVVNQGVGMKISILQGSAVGVEVYKELFNPNPMTNSNGLVTLEIGTGLPLTGTFSAIDWSNGSYFIKTETDPTGGTNYTVSGTSQLLSVPFALYAANSGTTTNGWGTTGNAGTTAVNFIGTTDDNDVVFKRNNIASGKIATNSTSFGLNALNPLNTGVYNTAIGINVLAINTTGSTNSAFGDNALHANTIGGANTATGERALFSNTTGNFNTATGAEALYFSQTGSYNSANGYGALWANTTGSYNTASGSEALYSNTTGQQNTANGRDALYNNTAGNYNTAIGIYSLNKNSGGNFNTGTGRNSLYYNTIGLENVATGSNSLYNNTTGSSNTANGSNSLFNNTTGNNNTAVGMSALSGVSTGNNNTAVGHNAYTTGNFSNSSAIGDSANITASNQIRLGDSGVTSIGGFANWTNVSDGRFKKDIQSNVPGLAFIKKLNPVTYHLDMNAIDNFMKTSETGRKKHSELAKGSKPQLETGFVAQEVEQAAKELGFDFSGVDAPKSETDYYGLRYSEFVVPLVKAVQEQQVIIEKLLKRIDKLEQR